ncbi:MAG: hypothetical protein U9R69_00525 [Thermodesulfobacteriota bacterium]|nr:hypothetical protein [Thermodesulfobacteriota bacterium]
MLRIGLLLLLGLTACMPVTPLQPLPDNCRAEASPAQLMAANWLNQAQVWRLRQVTLLEVGGKKFPLEGFLRLDLAQGEARLVAMNEIGLVLFDLQVTRTNQHLQRALPQLRQIDGFAVGVAQSLRQIFLQSQPQVDDRLVNRDNIQQFRVALADGRVDYRYDCRGDLRTTRLVAEQGDWRVAYDNYQQFGDSRIPEQIIMNDYHRRVKLSLWIREARQEL